MRKQVVAVASSGSTTSYAATTLSGLGKNEAYLEDVVARGPALLGLESRSTGISGPFAVFRQLSLHSPQGRVIRPDLLLLASSGDVIVVEVKLYSNPELRDRRVVAQAIDYVACLSALDDEALCGRFGGQPADGMGWERLVATHFPDEGDVEELAVEFRRRIRSGQLHIVIACDRCPEGLKEIVQGVTSQDVVGYELSVVELRPYTAEGSQEVLFVPSLSIETETVSRTVIEVRYRATDAKPEVGIDRVETTRSVLPQARTTMVRQRTPVREALDAINEGLEDLRERRGRNDDLGCWRGYDLFCHVRTPALGRAKFELAFLEFKQADAPGPEHADLSDPQGPIFLRLSLEGKRDIEARIEAAEDFARRLAQRDELLSNSKKTHAHSVGLEWWLPFELSLLRTPSTPGLLRFPTEGVKLCKAMIDVIRALAASIRSTFKSRRDLALENLALRQQLAILRRGAKRPKLRKGDRAFWVALSRFWADWRDVVVVVQPATVVGWHRKGFKLYWTWKSRRPGGRPRLEVEVRQLIRQMAIENVGWGAPRIHGELLKLGFRVGRSTVSRYMPRRRKPPSQSWRTFLANHMQCAAAVDFFVVPTVTFRLLYVFVVLEHARRRLVHFNVTEGPSARWTAQQVADAFPYDSAPRFLHRDRDSIYARSFVTRVASMGIEQVVSAPRSPWQNPYVERVIGSIRRECTDHLIVTGEDQLRRVLVRYAAYYNRDRTHLALDRDTPDGRPVQAPGSGEVGSLPRVGGLHHRYERRAA